MIRQNRCHEFQKEGVEGSPQRGAARSKQAKHLSMTPRLLQPPLRAVLGWLCRRAGASAGTATGVVQFVAATIARTAARRLDASGGREEQAASRIEHQRAHEVKWLLKLRERW